MNKITTASLLDAADYSSDGLFVVAIGCVLKWGKIFSMLISKRFTGTEILTEDYIGQSRLFLDDGR